MSRDFPKDNGGHFVLRFALYCYYFYIRTDIAELLDMTVSAISHQLRVLKNAELVKSRRDGKTVFYSLADDHVRSIINQGMEHICE